MLARHHFGQQGVGDGKHSSRRHAHHEAHADIPREGGHRAADRRSDKEYRRQEDRGLASVNVGDDAPDDRAGYRPDQCRQRELGNRRLVEPILVHHPGEREAEARRLHDVDDEGDHQHEHQGPVGPGQRRVVGRRNDDVLRCGELLRNIPGKKAVGGDEAAENDRRHAGVHLRTHRHAVEPVMH